MTRRYGAYQAWARCNGLPFRARPCLATWTADPGPPQATRRVSIRSLTRQRALVPSHSSARGQIRLHVHTAGRTRSPCAAHLGRLTAARPPPPTGHRAPADVAASPAPRSGWAQATQAVPAPLTVRSPRFSPAQDRAGAAGRPSHPRYRPRPGTTCIAGRRTSKGVAGRFGAAAAEPALPSWGLRPSLPAGFLIPLVGPRPLARFLSSPNAAPYLAVDERRQRLLDPRR